MSQRAKVVKDTAAIMQEYEKCGQECDAIVDKILADIPVNTRAKDTEIKSSVTTQTGLTLSKKNVKSSSKSTIEPKIVGPSKWKTIRLGDEQVRQIVTKGEARTSNPATKKQLDKVPRNSPGVEGALDYLMRVDVKVTPITCPEKSKSSDSRSSKSTSTKQEKEVEIDKETLGIESIKSADDIMNKRSDSYSFRRNPKPTNRHSPSEANQQVQVLRKGESKRQIPELENSAKHSFAVSSTSGNDPAINIIELFGDSYTESGEEEKAQPNSVQACIWSDNEEYVPGSDLPRIVGPSTTKWSLIK